MKNQHNTPTKNRVLLSIILVVVACLNTGAAAQASRLSFPGNGWVNPAGASQFEDWGFGQCGNYVAGQAHLGSDSQGYGAGGAVRAIAAGTVVSLSTGWPGDAVGIEHAASDGSRFVAVYGHINRSVNQGNSVGAGQQIGTVLNQGSNSHLHFGVRPLGNSESGSSATLKGATGCGGPTYGYVNPIPWLSSRSPKGSGPTNPPSEGQFVVHAGHVYRIAGGAPIYISGWGDVGGPQQTRTLSDAEFNALRSVPADGTLLESSDGRVYVVAGGAPVYLASHDDIGGPRAGVRVSGYSVDNAGGSGPLSHLRYVPADGTLLETSDGRVYVVAGGAPVYLASHDDIGGPRAGVRVSGYSVNNAGGAGHLSHLRAVPADGTLLEASGGSVYIVAGGAPVYVSSYDDIGGPRAGVRVSGYSVDNAGGSGHLSHLRAVPADGTLLEASSGTVFIVAGGAPLAVSSYSNIGGPRPGVKVSNYTVQNAGGARELKHLMLHPANGTILRAGTGGGYFEVVNGAPYGTAKREAAVVVDQNAISNAGKPGVWKFLLAPTPDANTASPPAATPAISVPNPAPIPVAGSGPVASIKAVRIKHSKKLTIRTTNVGDGQKLDLVWAKGSRKLTKSTKVKSGVAKAKAPSRKGTYKLTIKLSGRVLLTKSIKVK